LVVVERWEGSSFGEGDVGVRVLGEVEGVAGGAGSSGRAVTAFGNVGVTGRVGSAGGTGGDGNVVGGGVVVGVVDGGVVPGMFMKKGPIVCPATVIVALFIPARARKTICACPELFMD